MSMTEIPVIVTGCEKWVTGLTKRTTCDDIVYALLHSNDSCDANFDTFSYAIYERWRDVERPLQGRTKILKVWRAWNNEQHNVTFTMKKVQSVSSPEFSKGKRSRVRRRSSSRKSSSDELRNKREYRRSSSNHKSGATIGGANGQLDSLIQQIISQEKQLQQQVVRLEETDRQIEKYETRLHMFRVKELGENYVQETYMKDQREIDNIFKDLTQQDKDEYKELCERILLIEDLLVSEEDRIGDISAQIMEETYVCSDADNSIPQGSIQETNVLESALQMSVSLGANQTIELDKLNNTLGDCNEQIVTRRRYLEGLLQEVRSSKCDHPNNPSVPEVICQVPADDGDYAVLDRNYANHFHVGPIKCGAHTRAARDIIDKPGLNSVNLSRSMPNLATSRHTYITNTPIYVNGDYEPPQLPYVTVLRREPPSASTDDLLRAKLNKPRDVDNDSNSDTGLSSLHSDETIPVPILETLV